MDTTQKKAEPVQGPAWLIENEYPSISSKEFAADRASLEKLLGRLEELSKAIEPLVPRAASLEPAKEGKALDDCVAFTSLLTSALVILNTMSSYSNCCLAVDGSNAEARAARSELSVTGARLEAASGALNLVLCYASDAFYEALLARPGMEPWKFEYGKIRAKAPHALSLEAEKTLSTMSPDGLNAWGQLYDAITGTLAFEVPGAGEGGKLGLAEASALLRRSDRALREAAYRAIARAFAGQAESCAAMLNAISGWRHAEGRLRSVKKPRHFLDEALEQNNIGAPTLEALIGAIDESVELGRRAVRAQARLLGLPRLAPWDLLAEPPREASAAGSGPLPFDAGFALVREAYASVSPRMADFADEMLRERRIEGRNKPGKRPGAYCTEFEKSRTARVYMTYSGSQPDAFTLAHEMGHAFHANTMRDLHLAECNYPMALAETASTFAETALGDLLERRASCKADRLAIGWSDAQDAASFLCNIPARFDFEKAFYEARASRSLSAAELSSMMEASWRKYYGDALSEYDSSFWMSKLHFYKTGVRFYNFPYCFGYLFSLGLYGKRVELGERFIDAYVALLRDTGRMPAEELAKKHLGVDLAKRDFWRSAIAVVERKVARFEALVN